MGVFGGYVFGGGPLGDVYGPDGEIRVEVLTNDTLLVSLDETVVVDSTYLDVDSYAITAVDSGEEVSIREVLPPLDGRTTQDVILVVDRPTEGSQYTLTISALNVRGGSTASGSSDFIMRRTKTENMLRAVPSHFNTRHDSVIRGILTAIGLQDDIIGGSRSDTFE